MRVCEPVSARAVVELVMFPILKSKNEQVDKVDPGKFA